MKTTTVIFLLNARARFYFFPVSAHVLHLYWTIDRAIVLQILVFILTRNNQNLSNFPPNKNMHYLIINFSWFPESFHWYCLWLFLIILSYPLRYNITTQSFSFQQILLKNYSFMKSQATRLPIYFVNYYALNAYSKLRVKSWCKLKSRWNSRPSTSTSGHSFFKVKRFNQSRLSRWSPHVHLCS